MDTDTDADPPAWARLFERGATHGVEEAAIEAALAARRDETGDTAEERGS